MTRQTADATTTPAPVGDDAFLLALVQSGDEQAISALFNRHSKIVYSIALRVLSDPTSADDVVHEIFMQIWRNPDGFNASPANFASEAEGDSFMERARSVMQQLPSDQRKTLEMAFFDGLNHTEIAEMNGETPDVVKARIRQALLPLRKEFQS